MICPVCKYVMVAVEYHDIELDYCNSCKGGWFDSGELELLLRSHSLEEPKAFFDGILNSQEAASSEKKRNCPLCGRKMKKTAIGEQSKTLTLTNRHPRNMKPSCRPMTELVSAKQEL